ncbi:MAG: cytochrome c family protein [Rickettsiaceae bacterium H1]|nr:cytochrome c family protein [Rickettsiaceae bacterium H1]
MKDLELNKIFASILFVSVVMVGIGVIVDALYKPSKVMQRGFQVEVSENIAGSTKKEEMLNIPALLASASMEKGKVISKKCIACHSFDKGGANKVGPNLWGIVGNKKARLGSNFNYSQAILKQGGDWGYDELFHFLRKPQKYISGTKMAFAGISKPEQIADVIVYLNSMSDNSLSLPQVKLEINDKKEEEKNSHTDKK